ncbi:unnamed protein product [Rotaria socialis]|uniref:Cadherin domain-containing protein n=1 Tax=Rotaria socialis TaxID=392032 RepID=A0A821LAT3_9BILA|nr:unnamed protein product [Rotaria socialis]
MDFVLKENGQPSDIISLILTVEDVNEFRPQFLDVSSNDQVIQLNLSEGVPVGHVLPIPSATDKDGEDDELIYWLEKTAKIPFELVSFGSNQIALNVTEPLDREIRDFYEVKLTASDRGNLTSTIPIHISISDINDNVPAFDQQYPYTINISENTLPSLTKSLIRIHAVDNDSNDNSHISYQFSPQISELIRQTFQLNSETGELFLLQSLDFEQYKEYRIQVTAQDSGPVSVPVYTTIVVSVEDENDNAPIMNIRVSEYFHLINDTLYISEETPLNTLLMHIIVQDFDLNLNGKVQCWIEPSEPKFNITNAINNMFAVYTEELFDREQHSNYSIVLIVEDNGLKNRHRTVRALQLIITDINDSPPIFTQPFYIVTIEEEKEYKQAIIQIHANDADLNENSQISYELITKEYKYLFNLDEKTGEIFLENKLDREIKSEYNLTIRAYDHGKYPKQLSTDVLVYIYLLDNNEFKPQFEHNKYIFHNISETISNHCLLSGSSLANDMSTNSPYTKLQQSIKTNGNSDTSSSYNDSCYGSSEMDVCHHNHHHHHQSVGNKLVKQDIAITTPMTETTGKILLSSNENYIILCKDSSASSDETNSSSPTSSSSSSPTTNNNSLITTCQPNKRTGTTQQYRTQLKSKSDQSNKKIDFFQNDDEYRKVLGSTASFNYRNITPLNEYYL